MSDLIDDPKAGLNDPEFTVSEISGAIKRLIEGEFSHVRLKGEIGRGSFPRSGHVYLDLKDEKAVISAVIFFLKAYNFRVFFFHIFKFSKDLVFLF